MTNNKTPLFYYLGSAPVLSPLLLVAATAHCRAAGHKRTQRHTHHSRQPWWRWGALELSVLLIYLCLDILDSLNGFKESVYYFPWLSQVCSDQQQLCFIVIIGAAAPLLSCCCTGHWTRNFNFTNGHWFPIQSTRRGEASAVNTH